MSKTATILLLSSLLGTGAMAQAPHERQIEQEQLIQTYGKIEAAMLVQLELGLNETRELFNQRQAELPQINEYNKGKLLAGMVNIIEDDLNYLDEKLIRFQESSGPLDNQSYKDFIGQLDFVRNLINEL